MSEDIVQDESEFGDTLYDGGETVVTPTEPPAKPTVPPEDEPPVKPVIPPEESELEKTVAQLREENNKLHGERSQLSNKVNTLTDKVDGIVNAISKPPADEQVNLDDEEYVTNKQLKEYKEGETQRYKDWSASERQQGEDYNTKYTEAFARYSIDSNTDDATVNEIVKAHDALSREQKLGKSTGDPELDAKMAYRDSENAYLRQMNSEGKVIPFTKNEPTKVALGVGSPGAEEVTKKVDTKSYKNLPDDAKEFIKSQGLSDELVAEALGK